MLEKLGFAAFDTQGVKGALHSHRDADRRLAVTPDLLHAAGLRRLPQPLACRGVEKTVAYLLRGTLS